MLRRVFIIASKSPLSINSLIPSSCAKVIALAAVMASTMTGENGKGAYSDSEAMAFPWQSWTTTPRIALPNFEKTAPSKFNLIQFVEGGRHWTRCWGRVIAAWLMSDCWLCWKVTRACEACWRTWALGKTFVLTLSNIWTNIH